MHAGKDMLSEPQYSSPIKTKWTGLKVPKKAISTLILLKEEAIWSIWETKNQGQGRNFENL